MTKEPVEIKFKQRNSVNARQEQKFLQEDIRFTTEVGSLRNSDGRRKAVIRNSDYNKSIAVQKVELRQKMVMARSYH